jgi:hypothetical protein
MSADGHADAGNVTQDDDTQAGDDYDDGLDDIAALHNNNSYLLERWATDTYLIEFYIYF